MRIQVIGLGGAGCRIADTIAAAHGDRRFLLDVFGFDVDYETVGSLVAIPEDHRRRYGHLGGVDGDGEDAEEGAVARGFDDLDAAGEAATAHVDELSRVIDDGTPSAAEAFLVAVGLGGITGAGAAPAVVENLQTLYGRPVYVLGTLPAREDAERTETGANAGRSSAGADVGHPGTGANTGPPGADATDDRTGAEVNAGRTLAALEGLADGIVLFDNDAWHRTGESAAESYPRLNGVIADRIAALFDAGEADTEDAIAQRIVDANDVARAFGAGTPIATIGHAVQEVDVDTGGSRFGLGLFESGEPSVDTSAAVSAIETVIRKAVRGKLTLECRPGDVERALLVVGGPPEWLNRQAIADGRRWVAAELDAEVLLYGDAPTPDREEVFAVVLLSGVGSADRVRELRSIRG